jgi:aminopeptidase N
MPPRNGNALTEDFQKLMEEASGKDLIVFQAMAVSAYHPKISVTGHFDAKANGDY